jgi:hypothetical protein
VQLLKIEPDIRHWASKWRIERQGRGENPNDWAALRAHMLLVKSVDIGPVPPVEWPNDVAFNCYGSCPRPPGAKGPDREMLWRQEYTLRVPNRESRYIQFPMQIGNVAYVYANVVEAGHDIRLVVQDPAGNTILDAGRVQSHYLNFNAVNLSGTYLIYADNTYSVFSWKTVKIEVVVYDKR